MILEYSTITIRMGYYNYLMLLKSYAINFYLILTLSATLIVDVFTLLRLDMTLNRIYSNFAIQ